MAIAVYVLCSLTSIACAVLLLASWRESRATLLLWTMLCFVGLALNNVLLFVDKVVAPNIDLSVTRSVPALVGVVALVYGLVREAGA